MMYLDSRIELVIWSKGIVEAAEIGVERGYFSQAILRHSSVRKLHLIDPWEHQDKAIYPDTSDSVRDTQKKQDDNYGFILDRFESEIKRGRVVVHRGFSSEVLNTIPDKSLDWIYIDGNHSYPFVRQDLELSRLKVKEDGFICGDDYIEGNVITGAKYGVIQAVDEFCRKYGWRIFCMADHYYEGMNFRNYALANWSSESVRRKIRRLTASYLIRRSPLILLGKIKVRIG